MKYVLSWFERPQGSPIEYENAQKRILEVFGQWKAPANFKIEFFVIRVGEWGGHTLVECDDPVTIHSFVRCFLLLYSRRDLSLRSRKPSAANSK